MKRLYKAIAGQGLVEFALVLPIIMLLIFSIIDYGRMFYHQAVMSQATREATQLACKGKDVSIVASSIAEMVEPLTGVTSVSIGSGSDDRGQSSTTIVIGTNSGQTMTVCITPTYNNSLAAGDKIRVVIMYRMEYITPLTSIFGQYANLKTINYSRIALPPQ